MHIFPSNNGEYTHVTIQDFKIIEPAEPDDEILLRIEYHVPLTGQKMVNRRDEMMTISEFKDRFFNGNKSERIEFTYGYSIWILAGITDEKGVFCSLDGLPHRKNIEYFEISMGYEAHYKGEYNLL